MEKNKKKKSDAGKGDSPRPFSDYEKYLQNWDKIFAHDDLKIEPISGEISLDNFKPTRVCNHKVKDMMCVYCGKSLTNILSDGESYYQEF